MPASSFSDSYSTFMAWQEVTPATNHSTVAAITQLAPVEIPHLAMLMSTLGKAASNVCVRTFSLQTSLPSSKSVKPEQREQKTNPMPLDGATRLPFLLEVPQAENISANKNANPKINEMIANALAACHCESIST
jgi:hypothetical protein